MEYIIILSVILICFTAWKIAKYIKKDQVYLHNYALAQKIIKDLVDIYFESQVIPQALLPDNEFKAEELEGFRNGCIKFVLMYFYSTDFGKSCKEILPEAVLAHYADYYFVQKSKSLRGVRV